ncbi:MAG: DUF2341 domain-containing protein [Chlorobi bacterium]|nr:DUF2341 domain-containing protein [Chlorobiota bacterium]
MNRFTIILWVIVFGTYSQNVGIGVAVPHPSAKLEVQDTSRGVLIPRLSTAQRDANITSPATGLIIYNTTCNVFQFWNGVEWVSLLGSAPNLYSQWCSNLRQWSYRIPITLTNISGNTIADVEIPVTINTAAFIGAGKMQSTGADIRFTDSSCNPLPYYIEKGINTTATKIWVRVPLIPPNSSITIYMYYGNQIALPGSDASSTFHFWEDFNNTAQWSSTNGTIFTLSGGILNIAGNGYFYLNSSLPFNINDGYIVEARVRYHPVSTGPNSYSGVLQANSAQQGGCSSNLCGEAVIHYTRENNSTTVGWWAGNGSTNSYNIGVNPNCWNSADNTWYEIGYEVTATQITFFRDGVQVCASSPFSGWAKNLRWLIIGHFCCNRNIQDTDYDWIRIRRSGANAVTISQGTEDLNVCN